MASLQMSRRAAIVGGASLVLVAACGGGSDPSAGSAGTDGEGEGEPTDDASSAPELVLAAGFATGDRTPAVIAAGLEQRVMFTVADVSQGSVNPLREGLPTELPMMLRRPGDTGQIEEIVSTRHDAGIPTPYYPIVFTPETPGSYTVETTVDGTSMAATFVVDSAEAIGLVQVGEPIRPVDTPTFSDPMGVDPVCTRAPEPCPFHETTLTEEVESGRPVALLISTPAFCQTAICGPVLDLLIDAQPRHPDMAFVHSEVYNDPSTLGTEDFAGTTDAVDIYGMSFEPSLIVANASGLVTARLDFTFDAADLESALSTAET